MAKRVFKLPRQDELTKDQRKVLRLPEDGRYLIVGAPGTGKSVVALLRLMRIQEPQHSDNVHFLIFNHVLNHANKYLVDASLADNMHTAMSWLYALHWGVCKEMLVAKEGYHPDYETVIDNFAKREFQLVGHSLIIDEGQDLPSEWYEAVESLSIENFFVVADQNQQITEQNSNRQDLEDCLDLKSAEVIELKQNWRNTMPIATFCSYFYTDKSSPKPVIPNRPSINIPILYEYDNLDKVTEQILKEYDADPSKLIGVFVATDAKRQDWIKRLSNDSATRSNAAPIITTYTSSLKGDVNIDFGYGGIVVLNDKSVKGIEFDTVFIQTDGFRTTATAHDESLKKRLYVMSSRAREKLYLFKSDKFSNILESVLPPEGEVVRFVPEGESEEIQMEILKRRKL